MKERWRRYRDTKYEVSDSGRVRNRETGKILKLQKRNNNKETDYIVVGISHLGISYRKLVHRMVLEAFEGPSDKEVDHKNGIRSDNRLSNLEYVTHEENHRRAMEMGKNIQGKAVRGVKIDSGEILEFGSLWQAGRYLQKTAKVSNKRGVDSYSTNIKTNIRGKAKSAYGYVWSFVEEGEEKDSER